jgi:alpha/beta superfamily hydrolase
LQPFFIPAEKGTRFCLYHPTANGRTRGAIIYLHPFAEEMNKSRRMAALQARAMARIGYDVLQIDLLGCGDSSGDLAEARWQDWEDDVHLAHRWLRARNDAPVCFWGLRAGCLLAASAASRLKEPANFIFWQPVVSGKQHWQQFMRLKMASGADLGAGENHFRPIAAAIIELASLLKSPATPFLQSLSRAWRPLNSNPPSLSGQTGCMAGVVDSRGCQHSLRFPRNTSGTLGSCGCLQTGCPDGEWPRFLADQRDRGRTRIDRRQPWRYWSPGNEITQNRAIALLRVPTKTCLASLPLPLGKRHGKGC